MKPVPPRVDSLPAIFSAFDLSNEKEIKHVFGDVITSYDNLHNTTCVLGTIVRAEQK